jgi:hypothetical protein
VNVIFEADPAEIDRVVVGTTREAFLTLADDPSVRDKRWT